MERCQVETTCRPLQVGIRPFGMLMRHLGLLALIVPQHSALIAKECDELVTRTLVHEPAVELLRLTVRLLLGRLVGVGRGENLFHVGEAVDCEHVGLVQFVVVHGLEDFLGVRRGLAVEEEEAVDASQRVSVTARQRWIELTQQLNIASAMD